ncbi:hypothetical protein BDF14DRAFT_1970914 [Spinellus fusiger]|nr:hypothetical protein BDF14DRAFT_1970914 [Spinellus fusiger]
MYFRYSFCFLALTLLSENAIHTVLASQVHNWSFHNWNNHRHDTLAPHAHWLKAWGVPAIDGWEWPSNLVKNRNYDIVNDPAEPHSSNAVLRVRYPKGTRNPARNPQGGIGFYAQPIQISGTAKSVDFEYQVYFPKSFKFVLGGKLPGIFGGTGRCSGGIDTPTCFSTRFMWRKSGKGEVYSYLPESKQIHSLCTAPSNICNKEDGYSIGRGSFSFKTDAWTTVRQVLKLNTPGKTDGQLTIYANGKQVYQQDNFVYRENKTGKNIGIYFETFFGGSDNTWETPKTQYTYFKGFQLQIVA